MQLSFPQTRRRRIIGLTPLIDVVFILLVFFMLASSFTDWQSVSLAVPGQGQAVTEDRETQIIRLFEDGAVAVNGERLGADGMGQLRQRMGRVFAVDPERAVVVRPDAGVTLQRVVTVVEQLHAAGGSRITLSRESR